MGSCCSTQSSSTSGDISSKQYKGLPLLIKQNSCNSLGTLKMISIEQVWNIGKLDDFSKYLLFNLLNTNEQGTYDIFTPLTKLSYTLSEIQTFPEEKYTIFKKFIENKALIILYNDKEISIVKTLLTNFAENKVRTKLYFFDNNINNTQFTSGFSKKYFKELPYIGLAFKFFSKLKNENGNLFFSFVDSGNVLDEAMNKFNSTFIIKNPSHPISSFFSCFKIKNILIISNKQIGEAENNKDQNIKTHVILVSDFKKNTSAVNSVLTSIRRAVANNESVLVQSDIEINSIDGVMIGMTLVHKITDGEVYKIQSLFTENGIFIDTKNAFTPEYQSKITDALTLYGCIPEHKVIKIDKQIKVNYDELILGIDKIKYWGEKMSSDGRKEKFLETTKGIEVIMHNIISNPEEDKYYHIKEENKNFNKTIGDNKYSIQLFNVIGFVKEKGVYSMNNRSISYIKGVYYDYVNCGKQIKLV